MQKHLKPQSCWDLEKLSKLSSLSFFLGAKPEKILLEARPPPHSSFEKFTAFLHGRGNGAISLGDVKKHLGPSISNKSNREKPVHDAIRCYHLRNSTWIKLASRPDLFQLQQFLQSQTREAPYETIPVLDVVLRDLPSQEYVTLGRSFFDPTLGKTVELGDGIEYWSGYFHSLRLTQMGLSLNVNVSARSFYEPILVTEFISKFMYMRDFNRPLKDSDPVKVKIWDPSLPGSELRATLKGRTRTILLASIHDADGEDVDECLRLRRANPLQTLRRQQHVKVGEAKYLHDCWDIRGGVSKLSSLGSFLRPRELIPGTSIRKRAKIFKQNASGKDPHNIVTKDEVEDGLGEWFINYFKKDEPKHAIKCFITDDTHGNGVLSWKSKQRDVDLEPGEDNKKFESVAATGPIRNQMEHDLCSAYTATDLVSAARLIDGLDDVYQTLSVREICFYQCEDERKLRAKNKDGHQCHVMRIAEALEYIKCHGVAIDKEGSEEFNCMAEADKPRKKAKDKITTGDFLFFGNKMREVIKRLQKQPIGATIACFEPEFSDTVDGVYAGPTSNGSVFDCFHSVEVLSICAKDGDLAWKCKSSNGLTHGDGKPRQTEDF